MSNNRNLADLLDSNGDVKSGALDNVSGLPDAIDVNASAPADSLNIDSSGNVGIGTTTPVGPLQIVGSAITSNLASEGLNLQDTSTSNNEILPITFTFTSTANRARAGIGGISQSADAVAGFGGALGFYTRAAADGSTLSSNDERMRIDSSGNVGINTNNPSYKLQIATPNATAGFVIDGGATNGYYNVEVRNNSANGYGVAFKHGGTIVGNIITTGSSTSYGTSSDYRLKENIVDMDGAIDRVKALQPKRFNFIADADTTVDGFIAHEVSDVVPEAIHGEKDATETYTDDDGVEQTRDVYQGIDQSKLVPLLTGALQEAIAKIEALETRIEALENA